jgi:RNA recognition motif-containing protein
LNDDGLFNLFKQTNPKSARIQHRQFGTKSRGVGFVEYENEEQQLGAIKLMDGSTVEDGPERPSRKIGVVVSQTHPLVEKNTNTTTTATETQQ